MILFLGRGLIHLAAIGLSQGRKGRKCGLHHSIPILGPENSLTRGHACLDTGIVEQNISGNRLAFQNPGIKGAMRSEFEQIPNRVSPRLLRELRAPPTWRAQLFPGSSHKDSNASVPPAASDLAIANPRPIPPP